MNLYVYDLVNKVSRSPSIQTFKASFHIGSLTIAGSLKILPAIVSDYMETLQFQRSGNRRRSSAILRFSDSSDPAIVSDHMETSLATFSLTNVYSEADQFPIF